MSFTSKYMLPFLLFLLIALFGTGSNATQRKKSINKKQQKYATVNIIINKSEIYTPKFDGVNGSYMMVLNNNNALKALDKAHNIGIKYIRLQETIVGPKIVKGMRKGSIIYNWSKWNQVMDNIVIKSKFIPLLALESVPPPLAKTDNKVGWNNRSIVKSYEEWSKLIRDIVRHSIDRYGRNEVSKWLIEAWNEPDAPLYFPGTWADFLKLYKTTYQAVKSVLPKIKVGGPAGTSNPKSNYVIRFMDAISQGKIKADFLSWHAYGGSTGIPSMYRIERKFLAIKKHMQNLKLDLPWLITEYGITSYKNPLRDTPYNAAFMVHSLKHIYRYSHVKVLFYHGLQGLKSKKILNGENALMTYQGVPKPSFYAYQYLNKLAGYVGILSSKSGAIDGFAVWNRQNRKIQLLVSNFVSKKESHFTTEAEFIISLPHELSSTKNWKMEGTYVDSKSGNTSTLIRKDDLTTKEISKSHYSVLNQLKPDRIHFKRNILETRNGKIYFQIQMPVFSVYYIELYY